MVKSLCDICLLTIQGNLDRLPNIGNNIPTLYKEVLLERLGFHDNYESEYVQYVSRNLFCASLKHVNFYKCEQVDDKVLKLLGQSGCKLLTLTIHGCNSVTDQGVQAVTKNQTELSCLKLKNLKRISNSSLTQVRSEHLKIVDLKGSSNVHFEDDKKDVDKGVTKLSERNPSIQELYLSGIDEIVGENARSPKALERQTSKHTELVKIIQCLGHSLEILHTELNQVNDDCLMNLSRFCPNLKRLNLHGSSKITGEALTKFSMGCMSLESLDLSFCNGLSKPPCCESLWTLPTALSEISLCGVLLTDETILVECFMRLRNLKSARLCGIPALNDKTLTQILENIGHFLTALDLSGCVIGCLTDDGLGAVSEYCHNLTSLSLNLLSAPTCWKLMPMFRDPDRAKKFTKLNLCVKNIDQDIIQQVITSCHNLEHLDLAGLLFITDDHLFTIAENCTALTTLSLKGCQQVTDKGVCRIVRACSLTHLVVAGIHNHTDKRIITLANVEFLAPLAFQVTDKGVCKIVRACSLTHLVVAGIHNLTDKSIFALANACHYLEEIYLNGCANVSPSAVRYLIDCTIPRLFVKHVTPNARPDHLMAYNLDTGEFCRADLMLTAS